MIGMEMLGLFASQKGWQLLEWNLHLPNEIVLDHVKLMQCIEKEAEKENWQEHFKVLGNT